MRDWIQHSILLLLTLALAQPIAAQDKVLPRVLVIGDAVYYQYTRNVIDAMKDKAEVTVLPAMDYGLVNSQTILDRLDAMLGRVDRNGEPLPKDNWPTWDMIHFNAGLGDLIYRVPDMKDFRVLPIHAGGVVASDTQQYKKNLEELVNRLKELTPNAKLVWASTTPIRASTSNVFKLGSEIEYNAIAAKVMDRHQVPINDMHTYVKHLINMDKPASHGFDPFDFDKKPIHMPIVRMIERTFDLHPMPQTEEEKTVEMALQANSVKSDQ